MDYTGLHSDVESGAGHIFKLPGAVLARTGARIHTPARSLEGVPPLRYAIDVPLQARRADGRTGAVRPSVNAATTARNRIRPGLGKRIRLEGLLTTPPGA